MTFRSTSRIACSPDAVSSAVGDETVILHLKSGIYFGLDPVGTRIWTLLKDGITPLAIFATLAAEYDVERDAIERDARHFLEELRSREMIVDA